MLTDGAQSQIRVRVGEDHGGGSFVLGTFNYTLYFVFLSLLGSVPMNLTNPRFRIGRRTFYFPINPEPQPTFFPLLCKKIEAKAKGRPSLQPKPSMPTGGTSY